MKSMVPGLLIECGWPYKTQPENIYIAPGGTRTLADGHGEAPYGLDRICVLFVAEKVREGREIIRGTARDITDWFGVDWRPDGTMTRLRRVASCRIARPNGRGGPHAPTATSARVRRASPAQAIRAGATSICAGAAQGGRASRPRAHPWWYVSDQASATQRPADLDMFLYRGEPRAPGSSRQQPKAIARPVMPGRHKPKP